MVVGSLAGASTLGGSDMFGMGQAVAGIADEASEILNELDRPIFRTVTTRKIGKNTVQRNEYTFSKLDGFYFVFMYYIISELLQGNKTIFSGEILEWFKGWLGGWNGSKGDGLASLGDNTLSLVNEALEPYYKRELKDYPDITEDQMRNLADMYQEYREGTLPKKEEKAMKDLITLHPGFDTAMRTIYRASKKGGGRLGGATRPETEG